MRRARCRIQRTAARKTMSKPAGLESGPALKIPLPDCDPATASRLSPGVTARKGPLNEGKFSPSRGVSVKLIAETSTGCRKLKRRSRVRRCVLRQEHNDPGQGETCNRYVAAAFVARVRDDVLSMADVAADLKVEVDWHRAQHCQSRLDVERVFLDENARNQ